MNLFKHLPVFACLILFSVMIKGQEADVKFKHLTIKDGLSQNWIICVYKDSYGYMWFGTVNNGLNRYDGYKFYEYKNSPKSKEGLSNNNINVIYEDRHRNLWVGTYEGLNKYDREHDNFTLVNYFKGMYITGISERNDGKLYITTLYDLFLFDPLNYSIKILIYGQNTTHEFTGRVLLPYDESKYLVTTRNGLFFIDTIDYVITPVDGIIGNSGVLNSTYIKSAYKDSKGRIWLGTDSEGLFLIRSETGKISGIVLKNFKLSNNERSISNNAIEALQEDDDNNLWIGTGEGGIYIINLNNFNENNPEFLNYRDDSENDFSISNNFITSIYKDNEGTIWVSNYFEGISYYNKLLFKFRHVKSENNNGLNDNHVYSFLEDGRHLWIGTQKGLNAYDRKNDKWLNFIHDDNDNKGISFGGVWCIFKDSRKNLWIGHWYGGLDLFDESTNTFTHFYYDKNDATTVSSNNIFGITEDTDSTLWIATMGGGLNKFDYKTKTFKRYIKDNTESGISSNWIKTLLQSHYNEIWVATANGLDLFDKKEEKFSHFCPDSTNPKSISSSRITVLLEDSKKNIWIGTENGLNIFNPDSSNFLFYGEEDGLPSNVIKGLCEDDHGNLWISTNKGISEFLDAVDRPAVPEFKNYGINDGLQGEEFNSRSCFKDKNGRMYFGGNNGFNVFHPDSIKNNPYIPKIVFTDFLVFNKSVSPGQNSPLTKQISETEEITLTYKQSVFSFEFAALNYLAPENNEYAYMMEGFEKEWNYVKNKREATYTNLDPGKYIFHVIASNNDGLWNMKGISVRITIMPPWWKTLFFKIVSLLLILSLVVGFYFYRINSLKRQKSYLEDIVKKRTAEIEIKNAALIKQTEILNETNTILTERQQRIEEQTEELREQAEELRTQTNELNEKNISLNKLNATKDKFFSIIAHDLINPFNSILGLSKLLSSRFEEFDTRKKQMFIDSIYQSTLNLFKLLENLLSWSRTQTGNLHISPKEFYLYEIIETNLELNENQVQEKNIKINIELDEKAKVYADPNMINTAFRNLLSNAIKFTENGEITVSGKRNDGFWQISISDTGVGIPAEKISYLFSIDRSKSSQGTRGESGTGLGLIICVEFIEKNNGKIFVQSEIGKGSVFTFTLPAR